MAEEHEPHRFPGQGAWRSRTPPRRSGLPLALAILAVIGLIVLAALAVDAMR